MAADKTIFRETIKIEKVGSSRNRQKGYRINSSVAIFQNVFFFFIFTFL